MFNYLFPLAFFVFPVIWFLVSVHFSSKTIDSFPSHQRFTCGEIAINLSYPITVVGDPHSCRYPNYWQLSCEQNRSVLYPDCNSKKYYYVLASDGITTSNSIHSIRVVDPGVQKNNCSTVPLYSFEESYVGDDDDIIIFLSCGKPVESPLYIDTSLCLTGNEFSDHTDEGSESIYSYVVFGKAKTTAASDIEETCTIYRIIRSPFPSLDFSSRGNGNISFQDIHDAMAMGFMLKYWVNGAALAALPFWIDLWYNVQSIGLISLMAVGARAIVGSMVFFAFLIYKCRRRHLSIYDTIEEFLQSRNNMVPIRYSYKQIKKMTNNFKEKLGEGGYGSVYKGKLCSGQFVAVKMLTKSKANGQDFINEVATLGRIHHLNVVRLVGFCATTSKNALVYDYMPNGSLDKFIFAQCPNDSKLRWSNIHEIAMGVARGIEYLHQGCNMQILHFDIKPHNILLDENFVPKVSDFGLAKLRPIKNNVVTMTAVRGTLGYMAPELFYKKIGDVSYKADVYSFGMVLMEMAGRRRNLNANAEHSSQIYFPSWIYDQFHQGADVEIGDHLTEEERGIARKLILIALWCIQMTPNDRPSMREVLVMLQSDSKGIQLSPKPHFYPSDELVEQEQTNIRSSFEESYESLCESFSLDIE